MANYSYTLYDTAALGNSAPAEFNLFQVAQGADSTHTESYTNMRGSGALPSEEAFTVERIGVFPDVSLAAADVPKVWINSFLEFRIADRTVLKAPLAVFADHGAYSGHYTQGTAADLAIIGRMGSGYALDIPIQIPGGTAFRVRLYQGTALSAANQYLKVVLYGVLVLP